MEKGEIKAVLSKDSVLAAIIQNTDLDWNIPTQPDVYFALLRSIIGQQLSVKAAATIYERFLSLFGTSSYPSPDKVLRLDIETLRAKGLSKQKAGYLQNIADYFLKKENQNINWQSLSDDEVIQRLTSIKGVGVWTVQMVLMFTLGRGDVFPTGDLGIRNGMKALYNIQTTNKKAFTQQMEQIAEKWKPYRSYACRYIWAAKDA